MYHLPLLVFYNSVTFPTVFASTALLRHIFIREQIQIVHAHAAFSTLGNDALSLAPAMGLKSIFTDHSIFGFSDASAILTNKLFKYNLKNVAQAICVSHTSRENTALRARLPPDRISVIPNAVDTNVFVPAEQPARARCIDGRITIVIMSRLVLRKGQ